MSKIEKILAYPMLCILLCTTVYFALANYKKDGEAEVLKVHIFYKDKEINTLNAHISFLQEEAVKEKVGREAAEKALGMFPNPNVPMPEGHIEAIRCKIMELLEPEDWEEAQKILVAISWVETRHRPWLIGTSGERSQFQIMGYHINDKDKDSIMRTDVGAKYAIKVMNDFDILNNPSRIWRYNGSKDYLTPIFKADRKFWGKDGIFS